jgi:cobalt-zinc-cadmium efflux system protein
MLVEVVAGYLAGSLALLADAGHMLTDAATLGLALGAIAIWIVVEAVQRLRHPLETAGGWVLAVGAIGLAVNLAAAAILHGRGSASLNVQGALRHVFADILGSIGVIAAGAVVLTTGWDRADPLIGLAIGVLVLASSWTLLRDSVGILLESTPRDLDAEEVGRAMVGVPDVREVHDLHVWTITSGFPSLSAHVLVTEGADCHAKRRELERMLGERFGLTHTTLQVEHAESGPRTVELGTAVPRKSPLR